MASRYEISGLEKLKGDGSRETLNSWGEMGWGHE